MLSKPASLTRCRSIQLLTLLARGDAANDLELLVLRHQLAVLRCQSPRPRFKPADRALRAALSRVRPTTGWSVLLESPSRCWVGIGGWSPARGPPRLAQGGHRWTRRCSS